MSKCLVLSVIGAQVKIEYTVKPSKAFDTLLEKNPSQIYIQIDPRPEGGVSPQTPRIAVASAAAAQASSSADLNREKDSNNNATNKDNNKDNINSNPFAVAHVSDKGESEPDDNVSSDGEEAGSSRKDEFSASSNPFATLSRRVGGGGPVDVASSSDSVSSPRLAPHDDETHSLGTVLVVVVLVLFVKKRTQTQL